jgi:hypothetical protein
MKTIILISLFLLPLMTSAHPVAFEGAIAVLGDSSEEMTSQQVLYSYRYWGAAGVHALRATENGQSTDFLVLKNNFLLKRWHQPESQGNIYLGLGYGQESSLNQQFSVGEVDLQADWESRQFYTMALFQKFFRDESRPSFEFQMQRLGIAPYYGDFEDLSIWLIAERSQILNQTEVWATILRFYFKNVLWEVGSTNQGAMVFNYMVHF